MSLAMSSGGSSSPEPAALGAVLVFYGSVADYAAGAPAEHAERIASLAARMGAIAELPQEHCDALYFAGILRNIGAIGNAAFAKGGAEGDRAARMAAWDVPAQGARLCARIGALPASTADFVRWQAECWDGSGYPDQLRWSGIPKPAALLSIASHFVTFADSEEALTDICAQSGRLFSPEETRTFVMWYHTAGGTIEPVARPDGALHCTRTRPAQLLEMLSSAVDAHNATPARAARVKVTVEELGRTLAYAQEEIAAGVLAAQLFGVGELRAAQIESDRFDPLARLGIEARASEATQASALISACQPLAAAAPIVRARSEWFDGTGGPDGLRHARIPPAAQALAVAIAYDALDGTWRSRIGDDRTTPLERLETAAGTQFDPRVVLALAEVVKAHA